MPTPFETLWNEPRAPGAAAPLWNDWALLAAIASASAVKVVLRTEVNWRPLTVGLSIALALVLPWRRTHPLVVVALAFGCTAAVQSFALLRGVYWNVLDTAVFLLILPNALLRWASGREMIGGLAVIALAFAVAVPDTKGWMEGIGAGLFLLFPAALGASARYRSVEATLPKRGAES